MYSCEKRNCYFFKKAKNNNKEMNIYLSRSTEPDLETFNHVQYYFKEAT